MGERHTEEMRLLGLTIAFYRRARGLTQSELAEAVHEGLEYELEPLNSVVIGRALLGGIQGPPEVFDWLEQPGDHFSSAQLFLNGRLTLQAVARHLPVLQREAKLFLLLCAEQCCHDEDRFWTSALV